ncbi:tRNA pseudouridine(38-40) synthase TruA [Telmatospirillum siberiense]|uniref:tRNA pseudouridine synthase A n=1 Tax=Telmatospirillum siberiense TaxID=382514 RepID=A0A2N3Q0M7_9PROT|nr:tRNA pseudouridine(38-40) synthase TruA [Telmatospirillum siberiense]PKU26203.1 tRNA pseudouridine(38-40) synthase TruA [Telmatospirillum siberiense]
MPRYKLTVEYDGTGLVGWQRQDNGLSVQAILETAVFRLSGTEVGVAGAGRTDAGVHATGQVAHIDLVKAFHPDRVRDGLNFWLRGEDAPVSVVAAEVVPDDFHARFSAIGRRYLYRIVDRRPPPVLDLHRVMWVHRRLDVDAMHLAAQNLVGHHDFTSFRASECQSATPVKTLDRLDVLRVGEEIHVVAWARSFLHHQVRNMVGTLRLVGEGKWGGEDVVRILAARDRAKAGPTAAPQGLYLTDVIYPDVVGGEGGAAPVR